MSTEDHDSRAESSPQGHKPLPVDDWYKAELYGIHQMCSKVAGMPKDTTAFQRVRWLIDALEASRTGIVGFSGANYAPLSSGDMALLKAREPLTELLGTMPVNSRITLERFTPDEEGGDS